MSIENVYLIAEQPIASLETLCAAHEIVLSRTVLCRALAIQIAEELDPSIDLPIHFETMAIPDLLEVINHHHLLLDLFALKLKLWMLLYTHKDMLHLQAWLSKPSIDLEDNDTLDDILNVVCFQDGFGEWMGQRLSDERLQTTKPTTPKVDVIMVAAPDIPVYEDAEYDLAFGDNPELTQLVSDVLAGETSAKKRRSLFASLRRK